MILSEITVLLLIRVGIVVACQWLLATFCLTRLAYIRKSTKSYIIWNLVIVLLIIVGGIIFLVVHRKQLRNCKLQRMAKDTTTLHGSTPAQGDSDSSALPESPASKPDNSTLHGSTPAQGDSDSSALPESSASKPDNHSDSGEQ